MWLLTILPGALYQVQFTVHVQVLSLVSTILLQVVFDWLCPTFFGLLLNAFGIIGNMKRMRKFFLLSLDQCQACFQDHQVASCAIPFKNERENNK